MYEDYLPEFHGVVMAATPKPIRKRIKKNVEENRKFIRSYNPQPTKQIEKKMLNKAKKHESKLNIHESPKHEKIRKSRLGNG